MSKTYSNTIFRFEWTCLETNYQYRLDCFCPDMEPLYTPTIVECKPTAITSFKCAWELEDGLPFGLGTQTNMSIEFDDTLLPVDLSNMLTDEQVTLQIPFNFIADGWNSGNEFSINVADKDDYSEYLSNRTEVLSFMAGNVFILSKYNVSSDGYWQTLCTGMQRNSDTYEWDCYDNKQSIEVTNLGRVVFEAVKSRWLRYLPVYYDGVKYRPSYIDYLWVVGNKYGFTSPSVYVGGCLSAGETSSFVFVRQIMIENTLIMFGTRILNYVVRTPAYPGNANSMYYNTYFRQLYDDCKGLLGTSLNSYDSYIIATVREIYADSDPTIGKYVNYMHGGVCEEMESRYPTAWDYFADYSKNRVVRERFDITYAYPIAPELGEVGTWALTVQDTLYNISQSALTTDISANMLGNIKFKVRDNVFNKIAIAPPETCSKDVENFSCQNAASVSSKEYNLPLLYTNIPAAGEDGTSAVRRGGGGGQDVARALFKINNLDKAIIRYSWAAFHAWQRFYYDEGPTCALLGALTTGKKVMVRCHEQMTFQISTNKSSTDFLTTPVMDFSAKVNVMDQDEYIYCQNNSGEGVIKSKVMLALLSSPKQCTLEATMRINDKNWFLPNYKEFAFNLGQLAPSTNPIKFSGLSKYFVATKAEIDVFAGTVDFVGYGFGILED